MHLFLICFLWTSMASYYKSMCIVNYCVNVLILFLFDGTLLRFPSHHSRHCRLQLKRFFFGTDITQKCAKWSQIGVHGLKMWQIFAKFQCASFSIRTNVEKMQYGRTKRKNVVFREKISLRSYTGHTQVGKNKFSDIIYLNWINLVIYNEI